MYRGARAGRAAEGGGYRADRDGKRLAPSPAGRQHQPRQISPYDFLVGTLIDRATLVRAERLAARWGVLPHEVLIATGWISTDAYAAALAAYCGAGYRGGSDALDAFGADRREGPAAVLKRGVLRGRGRETGRLVYAPGAVSPELLRAKLQGRRDAVLLAPPGALRAAVYRQFATPLKLAAAEGLDRRFPERSAKQPVASWLKAASLTFLAAMVCGLASAPSWSLRAMSLLVVVLFVPVVALRLFAVAHVLARSKAGKGPPLRIPDHDLPVYTLLVPLRNEARVIGSLTEDLSRLDYPAAKLDIKLILEESDRETIEAARALQLPGNFEVLLLPDFAPRTKPKALNYALPLVRGEYLTIYDAEDVPERDQLRKALAAFRAGPPNLACVQAQLAIDNSRQSWLTRQFAIEYAALFDGLLPALHGLSMPLPLGGTSNHFRVSALRWLSAWDPYNVTEDADLGIRLARGGYGTGVLFSTTFEEAPENLWPWVRQRTRWIKGYVQTWCVHMGRPVTLWRELGPRGVLGFQLMIGGNVLSALVHPWFYVLAAADLARGVLLASPQSLIGWGMWGLSAIVLAGGYLGTLGLASLTVRRRRLRHLLPQIPLMPVYWLLVSFAAYRGLWQFVTDRFAWEKTEHHGGPGRVRHGS